MWLICGKKAAHLFTTCRLVYNYKLWYVPTIDWRSEVRHLIKV